MNLGFEPFLGRHPAVVPVSNSEIQTFKDCPRRWWFSYYLSLVPNKQKQDGPLPLGTRVHGALQGYYTQGKDLLEEYNRLLEIDEGKLIEGAYDEKKFENEADLGRIMLEGYLEWLNDTGADRGFDVISAEEKLEVPILDGRVNVIGKLDMRIQRKSDGARLVMDHKTGATFNQYFDTMHLDEQLKLYTLLEKLKPNEQYRSDGAIFNVLKKVKRTSSAKPPFYQRMEMRFNRATMNSFWLSLHGIIERMLDVRQKLDDGADSRIVAPPRPTKDCTWKCPFFHACPMVDDGSAVGRYLQGQYSQNDAYARYETETE